MLVPKRKILVKKNVNIKGTRYDSGEEYEVDNGLAEWMVNHDIADYKHIETPKTAEKIVTEQQQEITFHPPETREEQKPTYLPAYQKLLNLAGPHLVEIYGQLGTGKSRLAHAIAVEAQENGKKVYYIDTEGGLTQNHINQLENYEYVGDNLEYLLNRVAEVKNKRDDYDLLIVDSIGHPVYVHYVEMGSLEKQLQSYQKLAVLFRDMVRFARGERNKDMETRSGLAIAINHTVSEFAKAAKESTEDPLDPFGGQIHRVPKLILRCEPVSFSNDQSVFNLCTFKARDLPRNHKVAQFTIDQKGVRIEWRV